MSIKKKTFFLLFAFVFHYLLALCFSNFPLENVNLLFYFPFFLIYTLYTVDNFERIQNWLKYNKKVVYNVIRIWTVVVGVSVFVPGCYHIKEGGALYFGSWCGSIFRLGPTAMFIHILAIICMTLYRRKMDILWTILPMFCYFAGSSRSYMVVGLCLFAITWYIFCDSSKRFWLSALPLGLVILVIIFNSPIGDKIIYTLNSENYGDIWFRITSSRSEFWATQLKAWNEMPLIKKMFGSGIDFTLEVSGLWGHNDFIEILCSFGFVGVLLYLYSIKRLLTQSAKESKIPFVVMFLSVITWFFNAFFNMHYVYFCAMLSYPFLIIALRSYYAKFDV